MHTGHVDLSGRDLVLQVVQVALVLLDSKLGVAQIPLQNLDSLLEGVFDHHIGS